MAFRFGNSPFGGNSGDGEDDVEKSAVPQQSHSYSEAGEYQPVMTIHEGERTFKVKHGQKIVVEKADASGS